MAEKTSKSGKRNTTPPVWEWILAAVGLLLVGGVISTMLYRAYGQEEERPAFEFSIDSVRSTANGYLVEFRLRNTGHQAAAGLVIEGKLKKGAQEVETSSVTLAYAPGNSERQGGLYFTRDPATLDLELRALGYEKP
jgi:uncharacterized protein (TIGR02588 family)